MWVNQMQATFVKAVMNVVARPGITVAEARYVDQVIRVADKVQPRAPREYVKLSFRTAQKLRAEGVLPL